ncbi:MULTISPECIES: IS701 family transposase [unclassified Rhizobacter]|uniref:IS701 family transposase n=1 Tax=unclassified Rhizobacter TaxID=2640088 RepID=UPI0006F9BB62|nr:MULTISPECIES: IS701 family transposase [unclassified Rhizobacter]KQU80445.1 DDE endonuclease [Rhizobacter sp. Root29]KQW13943.1 DDE endonuclease [Rhizobacter sp. Root1238]KRB15763.1 DDE endonuclease [Rhizobacter sp. Root16D2]
MGASERFDEYMEHLAQGLGHSDRHAGLKGYFTGLMLPLSRKSVEPMAARVDPVHASARHQALHHFVAKAEWSDREMLRRVCQWVVPQMDFSRGGWWIIDDTGFPKKGKYSVGVTRQYCGMLGKQDNCQVAVSVSLACDQGSVPVVWQLYVPEDWAADPVRRQRAGVPEELRFATKTQIALAQLRGLLEEGAPRHCVLADAGYGVDTAFRQTLSDMGLLYAVGVTSAVVVWPPGVEPLPPKRYSGKGRPPVMPRRTAAIQPMSVKALALSLPEQAFHTISWREGTNEPLSGRFAALRVRHAGGNAGKARLRPLEWLLIEWPAHEAEPSKYVLSTLPEDIALNELVAAAHQRWRIERDYQDLKQDFGLGHYEGRGWRGFHHHASLSIAAYGFLMTERLIADKPVGGKKNFIERKVPALPEDYIPRGSPARAASREQLHHDAAPSTQLRVDRPPRAVPLLRKGTRKTTLVTQ